MKVLSTLLLVLGVAQALDVEVVSTTCDESLPLTADLMLLCENGARCTFGQPSTVYGTLYYSGVDESGIENDVAYMTADLSLFALNFNLFDMIQVPLCDENTMVADENNENECPGDGNQDYSITYELPNAGSEQTSWLASGWEGSGVIQMFAEQDENMKIGECYLDLRTYVTQKTNADGGKSLIGTPSAAATAGIVLGSLAFLALSCLFCYCCRKKRKEKAKVTAAEDEASQFKRMEDEKSFWSGRSGKSSGTKSTKKDSSSVVSELP